MFESPRQSTRRLPVSHAAGVGRRRGAPPAPQPAAALRAPADRARHRGHQRQPRAIARAHRVRSAPPMPPPRDGPRRADREAVTAARQNRLQRMQAPGARWPPCSTPPSRPIRQTFPPSGPARRRSRAGNSSSSRLPHRQIVHPVRNRHAVQRPELAPSCAASSSPMALSPALSASWLRWCRAQRAGSPSSCTRRSASSSA